MPRCVQALRRCDSMQMGQRGATMNIGQLDGQPLALQIFNGMTAESTCVNERWAKDQLFRCVCFAGGQIKSTPSIAWRTLCFNLRPPCGGDDLGWTAYAAGKGDFNPRPPCGGRPRADAAERDARSISIHVLHVEDDRSQPARRRIPDHFNPRPPCGGRPR